MEEIIKLVNEDGQEEEFYLLATFGLDDDNYAALVPVDDKEELILMLRIVESDTEELILEGIENEEELNDVIDAFEALESEE